MARDPPPDWAVGRPNERGLDGDTNATHRVLDFCRDAVLVTRIYRIGDDGKG